MKILAIVHAFPPDHGSGAEWMMHDMMQYMMNQGHECKVWVTKYPGQDINGIKMGDESDVKDADILWSHLNMTGKAINIAKQYKKPLLHIVHNTQHMGVISVQRKNVYNAFNTWYTFDHLKENYHRHPYIVFHPNVDINHYSVESTREAVTLINLNESKGGYILRELAKRLPKIKFIGVKGSYGTQITDQPENVRLYENMDDIREVYRQTGILIMPSHYESYGRTAVEAMCSGIPVIANPTPGLLESCGSAGYFADRNKLDEWVGAIDEVFKNYEYWSKRAKLRAEDLQDQSARELEKLEQFCVDIVADKFKHNL